MASPIVKGQAFGTTETVTAAKLQNIVDNAAFKDFDGSTEVFNVSGSTDIGTCVLAGGLAVKTSTGQLQLKSQADQTVIGNVSGGAAVPTAVPIVGAAGILINDDALGTSDTKGATQGNIKAFAGMTPVQNGSGGGYTGGESVTLPNGLTMKMGKLTNVSLDQTFHAVNYGSAFGTAVISVQATIHRSSVISGTVATVVKDSSTSGFEVAGDNDTATSTGDINWFAIGH